jgi:hypothetical protein
LLIKFFQLTPKAHSNSFKIFSYDLNLIFSEEVIQYPRTFASQVQMSWNQAHAPVLIKSFPKTPKTRIEPPCSFGAKQNKTKQNYLPL